MLFVYVKYLYTHIPHPVAIEMGGICGQLAFG
jgi:hypothetical protein